jgi:hypothetical protein
MAASLAGIAVRLVGVVAEFGERWRRRPRLGALRLGRAVQPPDDALVVALFVAAVELPQVHDYANEVVIGVADANSPALPRQRLDPSTLAPGSSAAITSPYARARCSSS